jgi:3-hydroxyacyl-[acyl-carrier-protein] dehydratase
MQLNRAEIEQCIPHRPPFLWLDEVVELTDSTIHARKFLDPGLEVFQGHYPRHPIFPGVLECEMALQAAAVLLVKLGAVGGAQVPVVTRINDVKFRQILRPGDLVDVEVVLKDRLANAFYFAGKISSAGRLAARLEFACAAADAAA